MYELFRTIIVLSLFGSAITAVLLCLKPVTSKKFPAKWQYYVWVAVLLAMIIPVYKIIPKKEAQKLTVIQQTQIAADQVSDTDPDSPITAEITPIASREIIVSPSHSIRLVDLIAYIWFAGVCVFLLVVLLSYMIYLSRKRTYSVRIEYSPILEQAKRELGIKRNIRIRMAEDVNSPMLSGILFPIVYIPCREISDEKMYMVFLHELTHYKRNDLFIKWLSIFVNALHWFNPLCYLLCANISEACEVSCDMSVTKNMSDEEQKLYMKTILYLAE